MRTILLAGSIIVTLALISYSIGIISEQRKQQVTWRILSFLGLGLSLDIAGTACMIIGSVNSPFTYHGFMGYSALLLMLIDNVFLWKLKIKEGIEAPVKASIHKYSRIAYIWWVFVYLTGLLIALKK
jgi:uncharacterized repeat protein (TIGR03987 family)